MNMHRLLKVHLPLDGEGAFAALSSVPYGDGRLSGFIVDRRRKDCLEARFVEKTYFVDRIVDPLGEEEIFERFEYRMCDFAIFADGINMYLRCDGKVPVSFFSKLSEVFNFKFYYELVKIDVVEWARQIEVECERKFIVTKLYVDNYPVSDGVVASINVKGRSDVLGAAVGKFGSIASKAQKVEVRPISGRGSMVLSNSASLRAQGPIGEDTVNVAVRVARRLGVTV